MKIPKVVKLVHIPMTSQEDLEAIKNHYGITHTDVIVRGIQLAYNEVVRIKDYTEVIKLYQANKIQGGDQRKDARKKEKGLDMLSTYLIPEFW
jgi:hypothetical protein